MPSAKLYYVYDPMCSWCWGYKPVWEQVQKALEPMLTVQYVVGGLAPDSSEPMPIAMQQQIASYWRRIEDELGTRFNHDFWANNTPKRSTYPSCRAVLAARAQQAEPTMLDSIQRGYYLEARNPSDHDVLIALAEEAGLDKTRFIKDFESKTLEQAFSEELKFARSIGGVHFPSLFLETSKGIVELPVDYQSAMSTIQKIQSLIT
ncbi:DsbA family protein [Vibrio ostreicida]|uniref:DsbA family protein n=1 Tax=Vibrio ostreicida TaxID=526588 RepID=A0ABT8C0F1_9VIBR|nr:DsbA family protein [Vibrio ostreicida]MDN3612444.1 DsbA family protein [Vibrio ostreicida]NPD10157.1 DsbA family protein [Vibrio ostreicida]